MTVKHLGTDNVLGYMYEMAAAEYKALTCKVSVLSISHDTGETIYRISCVYPVMLIETSNNLVAQYPELNDFMVEIYSSAYDMVIDGDITELDAIECLVATTEAEYARINGTTVETSMGYVAAVEINSRGTMLRLHYSIRQDNAQVYSGNQLSAILAYLDVRSMQYIINDKGDN